MIHEFSFGMGPAIWSRKKGETLWSFRALPIGGFVKLKGEYDAANAKGDYGAATFWQKTNLKKWWYYKMRQH